MCDEGRIHIYSLKIALCSGSDATVSPQSIGPLDQQGCRRTIHSKVGYVKHCQLRERGNGLLADMSRTLQLSRAAHCECGETERDLQVKLHMSAMYDTPQRRMVLY